MTAKTSEWSREYDAQRARRVDVEWRLPVGSV
jgi:hypothetical protein